MLVRRFHMVLSVPVFIYLYVYTAVMVFLILIGASIFSLVFRGLGGDEVVADLLQDLPGGRIGAMIAVMLLMFLLGFVLDFIEITFVVVPIVGPVLLAIDDTLARKRGLKIFGVGMHHDPPISTRKVALTNWGHSWVVLGVIVRFPFCADRFFCLPILFRLYVNKKTATRKRLRYRTRPELAVEMLEKLCKHRQNKRFHAIVDSAFGGKSVLGRLPANCDLTSRLVGDARLYEAPPARKPWENRP